MWKTMWKLSKTLYLEGNFALHPTTFQTSKTTLQHTPKFHFSQFSKLFQRNSTDNLNKLSVEKNYSKVPLNNFFSFFLITMQ